MAMGGGQQENQHFFQEYTFKKIASCDVCKDFLRGKVASLVSSRLVSTRSRPDPAAC